jgi:hypothetical protein
MPEDDAGKVARLRRLSRAMAAVLVPGEGRPLRKTEY